jgi:hypothetical protein
MKTLLIVLPILFSAQAFAHRPLGRDAINAMNMMRSQNVQTCLDQLDSRHAGDFYIQSATFHDQGTQSEYHIFGGFLEGGDMLHGSAHVDVKVGLLPPMGPGYQCRIISERD